MQGSFRKLSVWRRAKALAVTVYQVTREEPLARDRALRDQMRRASVSIASNIAEGNERGSDPDACRLFYVAKGSAGELLTQLEIACEIGLLPANQAATMVSECDEIGRMLRALIDYRLKVSSKPSRPSPLAARPSHG